MTKRRLLLYRNDHPLLTYSIFYLFVTLLFAVMFWMMPGQFYHSTAMYEPILKQDEEVIHSGLQKALIEQGRKKFENRRIELNGFNAPTDGFSVMDVRYEKGEFIVRSFIVTGPEIGVCVVVPTLMISARSENEATGEKSEGAARVSVQFDRQQLAPQRANFEEATAPPPPGDLDVFVHNLEIPRSLFETMNGYADAKDGFAGRASGSFWRMLYLSTVTITTVGYGDIVPITPLARTLIAAEAVFGILVIGLYLNALSQRLGPSTPS